ncbi:MAG: mannose-6-phosphate isomerase, class I [Actinomycetota bacterium]
MDRLTGIVRAYDWGDLHALAGLLGHDAPGHPEAEYWLGAHPTGPSTLDSTGRTLDKVIAADPIGLLGPEVADRFGQLPFLVKLLAAGQALSIQAHPSAAQAAAGFAREEAAGVARTDPARTYRDANHKPELICALTPFEARCGFRDADGGLAVLAHLGPSLQPVRERLATLGPADTALWLLGLPPSEAEPLARQAVDAAAAGLDADLDGPVRAELASTVEVGAAFPGDVGVVVALLLNHVVLEPGEALFLGAGNVHAYLRGVGVEVMANSDNVIRGGLTAKHIDVPELAAVVDRRSGPVPVQRPDGPVHHFEVPVPDFGLTRIDTSAGPVDPIEATPVGPEILLVTGGSLRVDGDAGAVDLGPGQAAFVGPTDGPLELIPGDGVDTLAWRVTAG